MEQRCLLLILSVMSTLGSFVHSAKVKVTIHPLTRIVANISADGGMYRAISGDMIAVSLGEELSVLTSNGTSSKVTLNFRPDDICLYKLSSEAESEVHVVTTAHAERSSEDQIAYCVYRDSGQLTCNKHHRHAPPAPFVHSVRTDEHGRAFIYAVYCDSDFLVFHNVKGGYEEHSQQLPGNCACSSNSLAPVREPSGSVIVKCVDGPTYLYNLVADHFSFVSPSEVQLLALSSYNGMIYEAMPADELYGDILVQRNMVTARENASAQPFLDMPPAIQSTPRTIQDLAMVSLNGTELVFMIWNNTISTVIAFLNVMNFGAFTRGLEYVPQDSDIAWGALKGVCESEIFIESTYRNGTMVLMVIEVLPEEFTAIPNITTEPLDSNTRMNTSCIPQDDGSSDEQPQNPPVDDDSQLANKTNDLENPPSANDGANNEMHSKLIGFAIGVAVTLLIVASVAVLVMLICYRMRKSNGYNIEQYSNNEKV